jgi:8-oxo-dGTP pyrophosphatase MutT (NUDIX family)
MRWETHGRRSVYRSEWVELWLDDVEIRPGDRFEHHVLRFPRKSVTAVALQADNVLMIWRHRFITDSWGWEVPAGWCDAGEAPHEAAARELAEETGWCAGTITAMTTYHATNGISDMTFTSFLATDLVRQGEPTDTTEASRIEWIPLTDIPALAEAGGIVDGPSLTALSYYLGMWRTRHP